MDDLYLARETRQISQQQRQQKKLEKVEVEVLESLRKTYAKQKEAIEEIQDVVTQNRMPSQRMPLLEDIKTQPS